MFSLIKVFSHEYLTKTVDGLKCVIKVTETLLFGKLRLVYKEEGTSNQAKVKQFETEKTKIRKIGFLQEKTKKKRKNENKGKEDTQICESSCD